MKRLIPVLLILAACGDGATEAGPSSTPVALRSMVGDAQMATVATELPIELSATVVDASGAPVKNAVVSWVGDGSVFAPATGTGSDGVTRNQWTLDTRAGAQQMQARWVDPGTGQAHVLGTFTAEGTPDVAATFTLAQEQVQGFVGLEITAADVVDQAEDQYGNETTPDAIQLRRPNREPSPAIQYAQEASEPVEVIAAELVDTVQVSALTDLTQNRWSWNVECRGNLWGYYREDGGPQMSIDSAFIRLPETSVAYTDSTAFVFTDSAALITHWEDGVITTRRIAPEGVQFGGSNKGDGTGLSFGSYGIYWGDGDAGTKSYRSDPEVSVARCGNYAGRVRTGVVAPVF